MSENWPLNVTEFDLAVNFQAIMLELFFKRSETCETKSNAVCLETAFAKEEIMEIHGSKVVFPLQVGGKKIGVLDGKVVLSLIEINRVALAGGRIWRVIGRHFPDFVGLIRFDWVPLVLKENLYIAGIYEINCQGVECGAALGALSLAMPKLVAPERTFQNLVRKIKDVASEDPLPIVIGNGEIKQTWGPAFVQALQKTGLSLSVKTEEEMMEGEPPHVLWRWGAMCEYGEPFRLWLNEVAKNGTLVFNTLPLSEYPEFPGNKGLLCSPRLTYYTGWAIRLTKESLGEILSLEEAAVLKPLDNRVSGGGITFSSKVSKEEWMALLTKTAIKTPGDYGVFKARWLPRAALESGEEVIMDYNSTFWVERQALSYLYSIIRFTPVERYKEYPIINVARGGYFAAVEEE